MHLDTRKMMISPMEIITNGLRLFIDRSSRSGEEIEHSLVFFSMTIKKTSLLHGGWCGDACARVEKQFMLCFFFRRKLLNYSTLKKKNERASTDVHLMKRNFSPVVVEHN